MTKFKKCDVKDCHNIIDRQNLKIFRSRTFVGGGKNLAYKLCNDCMEYMKMIFSEYDISTVKTNNGINHLYNSDDESITIQGIKMESYITGIPIEQLVEDHNKRVMKYKILIGEIK